MTSSQRGAKSDDPFPNRGQFGIKDLRLPSPQHAAVLVCIFDGADGPEVVLTERARNLRMSGGEVALPGGKRDKEDEGDKYTKTLGRPQLHHQTAVTST